MVGGVARPRTASRCTADAGGARSEAAYAVSGNEGRLAACPTSGSAIPAQCATIRFMDDDLIGAFEELP